MTPINYNTFFELLCEDERNRTEQTVFTQYQTRRLSYVGLNNSYRPLPNAHKTCTRKPKVSAQQQRVYELKATSEEIYGKST